MKVSSNRTSIEILYYSAWFGLLTGLIEGVGLFVFRSTGWLEWRLYNRAIWYETFWIAPLIDLTFFSFVGWILLIIGRILPKFQTKKIALSTFVALLVFDWIFLVIYGRISFIVVLILTVGVTIRLIDYAIRREARLSKFIHASLPWLVGATLAILLVNEGGGLLKERIKTSNLPMATSGSPNVIVLVVDTLRADHLSSYGYYRNTTPFVDSLAQNGTMFKVAISASSWTLPSHASMLTGRYVYEHGADGKSLDNRYHTIGEIMQLYGYRTGAFSGNTEFFSRRQGFGRGFLHFEDTYHALPDFPLNTLYGFILDRFILRKVLGYEGTPGRRLGSDINHAVLNWLSEDDSHPFFVFMNYYDVHDPYLPPQPYRSKYASVPNPGGLINGYVERYHPDLTPEQLQSEVDAYDGSISYVDDQIKDLMTQLEQRGLLKNTIVIITSDHGESLGEHGLLQHSASLYVQEIHVPLIIVGPNVPQGKQIDIPISTTALPSTILSLINKKDTTFPGPSLTKLMFSNDAPATWPDPISEVAKFSGAAEQNPTTYGEMKSVFDTKMQYIVHEKFGDQLYNWRVDPGETKDLVGDSSSRSILNQLKNYLKGLVGKSIFKNP